MEKVKKCPFCGDTLETRPNRNDVSLHARNQCILSGSRINRDQLHFWNMRIPIKRILDKLIDGGLPYPTEDKDVGYSKGLSDAIKIIEEEMQ